MKSVLRSIYEEVNEQYLDIDRNSNIFNLFTTYNILVGKVQDTQLNDVFTAIMRACITTMCDCRLSGVT